jgi:iron(III) transport system permease protein
MLIAVAVAGVAAPLVAMILAAVGRVDTADAIDWSSLLYSSLYALLAALAAVALVAPVLLRRRARTGAAAGAAGQMIGALSLINMALPGVVLGAAYVIAFNSPLLPLYGTPVLLIAAYVAVQAPMLLRFLQAPVDQVHPNLSEAARLHGLPLATRALDINAPLLAPAFVWGWMMAFTQVFFELPISELLYPAGRAPVGVALVWLNQSLDYTQEARLALAAIATALTIAGGMGAVARLLFAPGSGALIAGKPA